MPCMWLLWGTDRNESGRQDKKVAEYEKKPHNEQNECKVELNVEKNKGPCEKLSVKANTNLQRKRRCKIM